jgi:uncharacterized membrane protein (UPF0182 family)
MFAVAYLILVVVSAIPLARTLLRYGSQPPSVAVAHRIYRDLAYIAGAVLAIIIFETFLTVSLQNYWFGELGQQYRYWFALGLRTAIFATVFVFGGFFIGLNLRLASRSAAVLPPSAPWIAGFIIAGLVAVGAIDLWSPLTAFLGATPAGVRDPVFGADLSFYLLVLPFYEQVVDLVATLVLITILAWVASGLLIYPRLASPWRARSPFLALVGAGLDAKQGRDVPSPPASPVRWDAWFAQGLMLGALFCLASGLGRCLSLFHFAISGRSPVVAGASWGDIHFSLPAYGVTVLLWLAATAGLAAAALAPSLRRWLIARPSRITSTCSLRSFPLRSSVCTSVPTR